jgi:hypothetical protein
MGRSALTEKPGLPEGPFQALIIMWIINDENAICCGIMAL